MLKCKYSWPVFNFHEEEMNLRDEMWTENHGSARLTMWDDANIALNFKMSLECMQILAYSSCYDGNCAKSGVYLKYCGWLGV